MIVKFKSIELKGFLSIGDSKIDLDNQGTVYVTGTNHSPGSPSSNGAGKSTIFEGIIYALTGTTLRGTKDVINMYWSGGYCEVTLELQVNDNYYIIKRTRSHPEYGNNLKIWKNDKDISGDKLRKSETILAQELGELTSSLISSVIILGQGLPNKFTDLKPTARKDRLEELSQSSEFINDLKSRLSNKTSEYNSKMTSVKVEEGKSETSISINESSMRMNSEKLKVLSNKVVDTEGLNGEKSLKSEELNSCNTKIGELQSTRQIIDDKLRDYNSKVGILRGEVSSKSSELTRLTNQMNSLSVSKCPTCGQYISSPDKVNELKSSINSKLTDLNNSINELNNNITTIQGLVSPLNSKSQEYSSSINELSNKVVSLRGRIAEIDSELSSVTSQIESLSNEIALIRSTIDTEKLKLDDLKKTESELNVKLGILDYLTKKSAREFRGYLLKGVVQYLNSKLITYSSELFGTDKLRLILDDNKIYIEYDNRPYENLSGGEKQRADLAMQFSLRDMLLNSLGFNCNLLVIDEGFDNLDASGVESLVKLINNMSNIDSVFTITHHSLSIPFDKTLNVIKEIDNVSHIEEVI